VKRLLDDIRLLSRAYHADHTAAGDVLDVLIAVMSTAGLIAHAILGLTLWEICHG
jgi:hypothetical protein